MIKDIGNILIDRIKTLPFIDKYAGIIKVIKYKGKDEKIRSYPASVQLTWAECTSGRYMDLVPDSSKKSILFLEDLGTRFVSKNGYFQTFRSTVHVVCWLNMAKLGYTGASYSGIAIQGIISRLPVVPFNDGIYSRIKVQVTGQDSSSIDPFAKYQFDETVLQYLMYPYDYFVIPIEVEFTVSQKCLDEAALGTPDNCLKA